MKINEAIKHCEEVAEENEKTALYKPIDFCVTGEIDECIKCAAEHRQLAEWLKELQAHREAWDGMKEGLLEMSRLHEYVSIKHMIQLIDGIRPKDGDIE